MKRVGLIGSCHIEREGLIGRCHIDREEGFNSIPGQHEAEAEGVRGGRKHVRIHVQTLGSIGGG
jgi:hypothetical protein